ncbi:heterokaryon incompatibility protein [Moelleriella libera RCEF 2490]|uniref:Heterokaryon incompatibility protein n=1 Tax=Moelleriella libera RCEF 2490 TaxID=1081109 RepID=A0A162IQF0_9HYPO|nr:heterokaryon incompatibility protein [Moelleriella libera RCEF 2490]
MDLDAKPLRLYNALSYVWAVAENDEPTRTITVEAANTSFSLRIHRPLEQALLHLVADNATHLPLFVDQICINQKDQEEKAHQVNLMRDIYACCSRTIVWLGPATRFSDLWFDYGHEVASEGVLSGLIGPRLASFPHVFDAVMDSSLLVNEQEREDRDAILDRIQLHGDKFPVKGYTDVLDRAWFNRLWTIQEACLAPELVMVCGNRSLCFDCFRAACLFYSLYSTHWVSHLVEAQTWEEIRRRDAVYGKTKGFARIFQERQAIHRTAKRQGLYDIIIKYNVNNEDAKIGASFAEDRIFALLGLAAEDDHQRQRIRVRYKNTDEEVVRIYTETAAILLETSVDLLLFNQCPKTTPGLPSWVPDWAMDLKVPVGYAELKEPLFAAGGSGEASHFQVNEMSRQMTIRGVLIDTIVAVGERTHRADPTNVINQADLGWAKRVFDEASEFIHAAVTQRNDNDASDSSSFLDNDAQIRLRLQICDSGLSFQHFVNQLGIPAGPERLESLYDNVAQLGQRILDSEALIVSYSSISRIYQTVGIRPWYFTPPSEMDTVRTCAVNPALAAKITHEALLDFASDMVDLCTAWARVRWASCRIMLRRRFGKQPAQRDLPSHLGRVGLDPNVFMGQDVQTFRENIMKNAGRRLYRTASGYVGMGPGQMKPGDAVVVFHGGTMPHVLRVMNNTDLTEECTIWKYVGEAFCAGIMNGEALAESRTERSFVLV